MIHFIGAVVKVQHDPHIYSILVKVSPATSDCSRWRNICEKFSALNTKLLPKSQCHFHVAFSRPTLQLKICIILVVAYSMYSVSNYE